MTGKTAEGSLRPWLSIARVRVKPAASVLLQAGFWGRAPFCSSSHCDSGGLLVGLASRADAIMQWPKAAVGDRRHRTAMCQSPGSGPMLS